MSDQGNNPQYARYSLDAIKEAVRADKVDWQDSVNDDLDKWGYTVDELLDCILALEPEDFRTTHLYDENNDPRGRGYFDDYLLPWIHIDERSKKRFEEDVYIKFKYLPNGRAVFVLSFHPSR